MRRSQLLRERRLARLAAAAFGLQVADLELLKSTSTTLYRLRVPGTPVLRLYPAERHPRPLVEAELRWLATLGRETDLLVPVPIAAPGGQLLVDVHEGESQRLGALLSWVPGRHVARVGKLRAELWGEMLGRLHAFAARRATEAEFPRWAFDAGEFAGVAAAIDEYGSGRVEPRDLNRLRGAAARALDMQARLGEGPGVFGLIQADTNLTNVKFDRLRVGLLDFEVCCYGYFLFDVTRALLELARMPGGAALEAAFLAGYQRGMPIPEPRAEALAAFKLMNLVDIASWALGLPPDSGVRGADALLERTLREVRAAP